MLMSVSVQNIVDMIVNYALWVAIFLIVKLRWPKNKSIPFFRYRSPHVVPESSSNHRELTRLVWTTTL